MLSTDAEVLVLKNILVEGKAKETHLKIKCQIISGK